MFDMKSFEIIVKKCSNITSMVDGLRKMDLQHSTNIVQRSSPMTAAALPRYLASILDPKHVWWLDLSFRGSP